MLMFTFRHLWSIDCGLVTSVVEMVIYTKEHSFKMRLNISRWYLGFTWNPLKLSDLKVASLCILQDLFTD